ncbi:MAG TPA: SDR family NAD(P)-dependent oxidoreductase [Acidimicrobiia bacterium]|jgi:NAD(P)-dependent dehydrogenase (short-subunit alcohol dehydrogenase family)|nr:SDR family NAD(P)-dependent oxidoreductase [Acidimicrobiia bacterium]
MPRTVFLTGATSGIGRAAALALAGPGTHLVLAGRSEERTRPVVEEAARAGGSADFLSLDLGSLRSVAAAATSVTSPIDLLVADAAVTGRGTTADGFDLAFGVNHLGHFLLVELLLVWLSEAASPRVVIVASEAHRSAEELDWDAVQRRTRSLTGFHEYSVSKLCNILHAGELARRNPAIEVAAVHPGVVATGLWRRVPQPLRWLMTRTMLTPEEGAAPVVRLCNADEVRSGSYWDRNIERLPTSLASDAELAAELWERSERWTRDFR